jgi:hypothetical protein
LCLFYFLTRNFFSCGTECMFISWHISLLKSIFIFFNSPLNFTYIRIYSCAYATSLQ